jgi:hypothetical protein
MGKDSLTKSTTKKKAKTKKEEEAKKKPIKKSAAKPKKSTPKKTAPKTAGKTAKAASVKGASKKPVKKATIATTKPKTAETQKATKAKSTPKARPAAATKTKKITIKELIAKKFEPLPGAPKPKVAVTRTTTVSSSPPIISASDPKEAARIRALLSAKYSMAEIKASAKPPEEKQTTTTPTPESPAPDPTKPPAGPTVKSKEIPASPKEEKPLITTSLPQEDAPEPISQIIKYSIAGALLIVLIILGVSQNNSAKYYIHPKEGALEIWKGRFSPKDKKFFMVLHGIELKQEPKEIYTRSEVYPMIFDYYLNKADTLLDVPGLPDFEGIKSYLFQAQSYVVSPEMKDKVTGRLNAIERMILLYKADVAISKGTKDTLKAAMKDLKKASAMVANPVQQQEIDQKIELVNKLLLDLESPGK